MKNVTLVKHERHTCEACT